MYSMISGGRLMGSAVELVERVARECESWWLDTGERAV